MINEASQSSGNAHRPFLPPSTPNPHAAVKRTPTPSCPTTPHTNVNKVCCERVGRKDWNVSPSVQVRRRREVSGDRPFRSDRDQNIPVSPPITILGAWGHGEGSQRSRRRNTPVLMKFPSSPLSTARFIGHPFRRKWILLSLFPLV